MGWDVVIIGNGSTDQLNDFVQTQQLAVPVFTDPDRSTYKHFELTYGFGGWSSLKMAASGWRAVLGGHKQGRTAGNPMQQGGVVVVQSDGTAVFAHRDSTGGDHMTPEHLITTVLG